MLGEGGYSTVDLSTLRYLENFNRLFHESLQHNTNTAAEEVGIQCGHVREVRQEAVRNLPIREDFPSLDTYVDARYEIQPQGTCAAVSRVGKARPDVGTYPVGQRRQVGMDIRRDRVDITGVGRKAASFPAPIGVVVLDVGNNIECITTQWDVNRAAYAPTAYIFKVVVGHANTCRYLGLSRRAQRQQKSQEKEGETSRHVRRESRG